MRTADKKAILARAARTARGEARYVRIAGTLKLRREGETWTFRTTDLVLQRERAASGSPLALAGSWRGHPASAFALQVQAEWLRVEDLWPLVLAPHPPGSIAGPASIPSGEIRSLYADVLRERAGSQPRFAASAVVADLSVRPAGRWPGLAGLTASLSGHGAARTRRAARAWRRPSSGRACSAKPIALERVESEVDWWRDGAAWIVGSPQVALAHAAGTAEGGFELRLGRGPGLPFLAAEARVERLRRRPPCASSCRSGDCSPRP